VQTTRCLLPLGWVLLLSAAGLSAAMAGEPAGKKDKGTAEEAVFEMREVSAFDESGGVWYRLLRGQYVQCSTEPDKEVKAYPKLRSKRPFYGTVTFDPDRTDPKAGMKFRFVLDESGEPPAEKPAPKGSAAKTGSASPIEPLWRQLLSFKPRGGPAYVVRKQASWKEALSLLAAGPRPTYDRLYFDANRDLDLTNDRVLRPLADPPPGALPGPEYEARQVAAFEYLTVEFDYGPGLGLRPFRILPRFVVADDKNAAMFFVATVARKGRLHVGSRQYEAVLAQRSLISGRYDRPFTTLELKPIGFAEEESWVGDDHLCGLREADGRIHTISTTPTGDRLIVRPYRGDYGVFAVGPGKRNIKDVYVAGSITSRDMAVPLDRRFVDSLPKRSREHKVPVGDYLPSYLNVRYGALAFTISENYHSDGRRRNRGDRTPVYMKVRKDKPFVLDFSNQPAVMFASPAKHQIFKPGDEIEVAAVLVDPVLDIMIRSMYDTSRKQKETYKLPDGKEHSVERPLSLDPIVTITNSSGKKVAEGKMPFG
jgi:hypothetical protein